MESPAPQRLIIRHGANLPHWRREGSTYATVFRLADSVPRTVIDRWKSLRLRIEQRQSQQNRPLTQADRQKIHDMFRHRVEKWLDSGYGECLLGVPKHANVMEQALKHFHGTRYVLIAWCVMPNHVHALLQPEPGRELSSILQGWKGYTAHCIRQATGTHGELWQRESYDRIMRGPQELAEHTKYILDNPAAAGLRRWPWVGLMPGSVVPPEFRPARADE